MKLCEGDDVVWPCSDLCLKQLSLHASFVCLLYLTARSSLVKPKFKKESPSGLKKKFLRCYRSFLNRRNQKSQVKSMLLL